MLENLARAKGARNRWRGFAGVGGADGGGMMNVLFRGVVSAGLDNEIGSSGKPLPAEPGLMPGGPLPTARLPGYET
jgi:hypothetical protein